MKNLNYLLGGLLLAGMSLQAQSTDPHALPCSTFEDAATSTNWVAEPTVGVDFSAPNPLDGTQCVTISDGPAGSWYKNSVDYTDLGQRFLGKCMCFDYYLIEDGYVGSSDYYPAIYLSDGINTVSFVSSTPVTELTTGWVSICAPIEHTNGIFLPRNSNGTWTMPKTMTTYDFNYLLDHVKTVAFLTDITSDPSEVISVDNVCVKNCGQNCQIDFNLSTTLKSDGTAEVTVLHNYMVMYSNYTVDWGDGSPTNSSSMSHVYSAPGSYNVCVTIEMRTEEEVLVGICTKCMAFCYGELNRGDKGKEASRRKETPAMVLSMQERIFDHEGYLIYPNPSQDHATLEITLPEKSHVSVRIIDLFGKVVTETSSDYPAGAQKIKLNTEKLPTGIYTVEINAGARVSTQKLSVTR